MSRQIPWARVFAEGVMIISSILIAFGIDTWWQQRRERIDEQAALVRIYDELVAERDRVVLFEGLQGNRASASLSLVGRIDDLGGVPVTIEVRDRQLAALVARPTYETETPTLDGLLRSGGIEIIRDADVRASIARWDSRVRDTRTNEVEAGQFVSTQLLPALVSRGDIGHVLLNAERGRLSQISVDDVTSIQVDAELKALIAQRYNTAALVQFGLAEALAALDSAVAAIRAALDP